MSYDHWKTTDPADEWLDSEWQTPANQDDADLEEDNETQS